ncbi:MmcQ/YjbR family DNA-binding protein [Leifsonia xyli]|uniref:MmcQ/YjbR family DNA-binding protein n=1 Tax=Leifsonia xyli TaxID=1575 RepID=UPI003D66D721
MDLEKLMSKHLTRYFDGSKTIPGKTLEQLLSFLRSTPSSVNIQPNHFYVLSTEAGKRKLADNLGERFQDNAEKVMNASHVVILTTRTDIPDDHLDAVFTKERADGRFAKEATHDLWESMTRDFLNIRESTYDDLDHWMEKQTYMALGMTMMAAAELGIDATPSRASTEPPSTRHSASKAPATPPPSFSPSATRTRRRRTPPPSPDSTGTSSSPSCDLTKAAAGACECAGRQQTRRRARGKKMVQSTTVQEWAAARAAELPGAERSRQDTGDWEAWKVSGKVFMLQTSMPGEPVVILKADPADALALREAHSDITPGYHMNKVHWITVHPGGTVSAELVGDLVTDSYRLVVESLPKGQRPAQA